MKNCNKPESRIIYIILIILLREISWRDFTDENKHVTRPKVTRRL